MILQLNNIKKFFGPVHAVDGLSLLLRAGETLSIVGESGCGKTTLARIIVGLIKADEGQVITQAKIQMVFQDPQTSLDPLFSIRRILQEAFYAQSQLTPLQQEHQMRDMLSLVGLEESMLNRRPQEFSGGQRQRIAIARALLTRPDVLVLDEPTSALDVLVQKQVLDLLSGLKSRLGLTYIFISHNLRVVKSFSDTIAVMRHGQIVETGHTKNMFTHPQHPYTKQLMSAAFEYSV